MAVNVSKVEPKYRRPLNDEQLLVLRLLYRFRFGTSEYIAEFLGKGSVKVVQKKLKILEDQGFISKRYDKGYKLAGRPAEYFLTPKGARAAMAKDDPKANNSQKITPQGIKNLYKNPGVSDDFIKHCLNILKIFLKLKTVYDNKLATFTRMQMIPFGYLPTWRPDLLLSLKTGAKGKGTPKRFFLDIWDGTRPFFVSVKKARSYIKYSEEGDWPTDTQAFPMLLILCDTDKNATKLRRQIRKALEESYEDMVFATTTVDDFLVSDSGSDKLWLKAAEYSEDDKSYTLANLYKSLEQSD